jgi:hypothetical protein
MNSAIDHSEDTESIVESLFKSNDPPPDEVRPRLIAKLKTLQDSLQRIAVRPFTASLEGQEEALPGEVGEAYSNSIHRYATVLSCKRRVPIELWQYIFEIGFINRSWAEDLYLQTLCSVCKDWRTAATGHCALWAELPSIISASDDQDKLYAPIEAKEVITRHYLLRSGHAPLTFMFWVLKDTWDDPSAKKRYQEILRLLTDQCHRWAEVTICLPIDAFNEELPCIQGNLPMLKDLTFRADLPSSASSFSGAREYRISCFREAPSLRAVNANTSRASTGSAVLTFDLPWPQLETFKTASGKDTLCNDLIQAQPSHLRSMVICYFAHSLPPLTKSPVTLPELSTLSFYAAEDGLSLTSFFDILTLPALSTLTVHGDLDVTSTMSMSMCRRLLHLIERSECSLRHLLWYTLIDTSQDEFFAILRLSPNLSHLCVHHINSEGLRRLVLSSNSPNDAANLVPNMRKMSLHHYRSTGFVDAEALAEMVVSRVERFCALDVGQSPFELVMEVELEDYDVESLETQWNQAISKITGNSDLECVNEGINANTNTEGSLADIASKMEDVLDNGINRFWLRCADDTDSDPHDELDREMRDMENLDLAKYQDVFILSVSSSSPGSRVTLTDSIFYTAKKYTLPLVLYPRDALRFYP